MGVLVKWYFLKSWNTCLILQLFLSFVSSFVQLPVNDQHHYFCKLLLKLLRKVALVFLTLNSFPEKQESKKGTDEGWIPETSMTLPHYFCLCSYLCLVVIVRINVILSIYFYLFLEYMRTFTPKWIVFHFLNLWKLGEGGKMNKVLGMLEAGNAACQANCINKTMSFSFSSRNGGYNHLFFFSFDSCFLGGGLSFWKRLSPLLYPWELDNVGSVRNQVCNLHMWGLEFEYDQNMVKEANTKIRRGFSWESWWSDISWRVEIRV